MKYIYTLLSVVLLWSCYDDKGNYDYNPVNEVHVHLQEIYVATSLYTDMKIEPDYSQTLRENHENLVFTWQELNNDFEQIPVDTLGTTPVLELNINADIPGFKYVRNLRLVVEDLVSGLRYIADTKLQVAKPFYKSWMILHEVGGTARLAAVEYLGGEMKYREDAYFDVTGNHLSGKPVTLGVFDYFETDFYDTEYGYVSNGFAIVTDRAEESGVFCQWKGFQQMTSFDKMVYPADAGNFDVANVSFLNGAMSGTQICLSGGTLYQSVYAGKFYKAHVHPDVEGDIDLVLVGNEGACTMFYDRAGNRFLWYRNRGNSEAPYTQFDPVTENSEEYTLNPIPFRDGNVTDVDPNALPKNQKILYMGRGYGETQWEDCIYAIGLGPDKCHVYEFDNGYPFLYEGEGASFKAYYEPNIPVGLDEESCLTTSRAYSGIFFYTSGNAVYRYDYHTGGVREIYRHEGAVQATCLDFAKKQETYLDDDPFMGNNYPMWQQMGVVFEMPDGTSEFVVLQLDGTGKVSSDETSVYPSVQVYKGLGKVADIAFV